MTLDKRLSAVAVVAGATFAAGTVHASGTGTTSAPPERGFLTVLNCLEIPSPPDDPFNPFDPDNPRPDPYTSIEILGNDSSTDAVRVTLYDANGEPLETQLFLNVEDESTDPDRDGDGDGDGDGYWVAGSGATGATSIVAQTLREVRGRLVPDRVGPVTAPCDKFVYPS